MKRIEKYILEKLKLNKDIKVSSSLKFDDYFAVYIGDASMKIINKFEDEYKLNQIYMKYNDCYIYILNVNEIEKWIGVENVDIYLLALTDKDGKPNFKWDKLEDFIKDCNNSRVNLTSLYYVSIKLKENGISKLSQHI